MLKRYPTPLQSITAVAGPNSTSSPLTYSIIIIRYLFDIFRECKHKSNKNVYFCVHIIES